jgi:murein L,D-transpeptidase YcbB/YkuD
MIASSIRIALRKFLISLTAVLVLVCFSGTNVHAFKKHHSSGSKGSSKHGSKSSHHRKRHHRHASAAVDPGSVNPRAAAAGIPPERVTEIQKALIKAGYLDGPTTGQYDDKTIDAMKEFQADNGLPETGAVSAPALKKLGVSKHTNDGYAVPVNSLTESDKKKTPAKNEVKPE